MFDFFDPIIDFVTEDIPYAISSAAEWIDETVFGYEGLTGDYLESDMGYGDFSFGDDYSTYSFRSGDAFFDSVSDYGPLTKAADYLFGTPGGPYSSSLLQDLGIGLSDVGKAMSAGAESFLGGSKGSMGSSRRQLKVDVPGGVSQSALSGVASSDPRIRQASASMLRGEFTNPEIRAILEAALARRTITAYSPTISPGSSTVRVDLAKKAG
jgi:hypothetical protein